MPNCGIVILAAGASVRMGVAKQSLQFEGSSLLARAVGTALASSCRPVVVVLGSRAEEFQNLLAKQAVLVVVNGKWSAGIGTSIRAGVSAIRPASLDAVMILLCDQPLICSGMLDQMVAGHFASGKAMTAAFYAGTFGTPVVFSASFFDEMLALGETEGGKALLHRHPAQVQAFPLPEAEMDVDRPEDFTRLFRWQKR